MIGKPPTSGQVQYGTTVIRYSVRRSRFRTTLGIAVEPDGAVVVTAPMGATLERIASLVASKGQWIAGKLRIRSDMPPAPDRREFVSGETFRYRGRQYRLLVVDRQDHQGVKLQHGKLLVQLQGKPAGAARARAVRAELVRWYRERAALHLADQVAGWAGKMGQQVAGVKITEPKKRWGSSAPDGTILLNWRIIQGGKELIDYVVVHELSHLQHRDHGPAFWALVGRWLPEYEQVKLRLRERGRGMVW